MGKRSEQSRKTYDRIASVYDTTQEGSYTRAHRAELIRQVRVKDGDAVLDVGCGNGELLSALKKKADVRAFGVDISENMIAAARERHPDCTFFAQPCAPLGFADRSIDAVTVSCAFHHFENPRGFVDECKRVLMDGGTVYMAEPYFSPPLRLIANCVAFPLSHTGDVRVYGQTRLCAFFEAAGFSDVRTYRNGTVLFLAARK